MFSFGIVIILTAYMTANKTIETPETDDFFLFQPKVSSQRTIKNDELSKKIIFLKDIDEIMFIYYTLIRN
ncbi:hypothetical protein RV10_GL004236 [Enterococcus pallens]|nr:hypothetical protein RV10_GL004236 [Enterococcus pallens]